MDNKTLKETNQKLTIGWLKESLASTIGADLVKEGFSGDKRNTKFRKKLDNKNIIEVHFDCYRYSSKVEFRLLLLFLILEIENETVRFYKYCGWKFPKGWTFTFSEGNFHPKTRDLEPKYTTSATHIVFDNATLEEGITDCRKVLKENIIPIFPVYSDLQNFQTLVLNDYSFVLKNGRIEPALIAAKLKSKEDVIKLINFLWKEKDMDNKSELHTTKILFRNMMKYVEDGNV